MAEDNIISEDESGPRPVARQTEFSVTFARERKKSTSKMPDGRTCLVLECSGRSFDNIRGLQEHIWDDHVIWKGEARGKRGRACVFPNCDNITLQRKTQMVHINSHVPFSLDKPTKADLAELRGEYRDAYSEMMNKSAHKWRKAYKKEEENDPELATERKEVKRAYDKVHHQIHKDRKSADLSRARATGGVKRKKAHKAQKEKVAKEAEESSKASSSRYTL